MSNSSLLVFLPTILRLGDLFLSNTLDSVDWKRDLVTKPLAGILVARFEGIDELVFFRVDLMQEFEEQGVKPLQTSV